MKNLSSRIISALIALALFLVALYFGHEKGIYIFVLLIMARGSFEISRMFFNDPFPKFTQKIFIVLSVVTFLIISQESLRYLTGMAAILNFILLSAVGILFHKKFNDLDQVLTFISKSCLGLIYVCFLPATAIWITQTNNGIEWFLCLLGVVFAGDIGAYIFGVRLGKTKIAPLISPNKSLQGALGGLLFSTLIASAFMFVLPNTPLIALLGCGLLGGLLGQIGDFFESLLKRVSGVKDSGSIMPGHGGVLDRLDGVLLAAPLFYIAATYFSL